MKLRALGTGALLVVVAASAAVLAVRTARDSRAVRAAEQARGRAPVAPTPGATVAPGAPATRTGRVVRVVYFHTTQRCVSCLAIERLTDEALRGQFGDALAARRLEWASVNVDLPQNRHAIQDYRLYAKSVVVSELRDGREVRWKNLERVWNLLDDPVAFHRYIVEEVGSFQAGS